MSRLVFARWHRTGTTVAASLLALSVAACSAAGQVPGDSARGQALTQVHCAACHGADGNSPLTLYPRLAGQRAGYLFRQLLDFRDGRRPSAAMHAAVQSLTTRDLADAAVFYATRRSGRDAAGPAALMALGEQLYRQGSADGRVTACAACHDGDGHGMGRMMGGGMMGRGGMHGMGMRGMQAGPVPRLRGQHADYLLAQLRAYADGSRSSPTMQSIATALAPHQRKALAVYLAAQTPH